MCLKTTFTPCNTPTGRPWSNVKDRIKENSTACHDEMHRQAAYAYTALVQINGMYYQLWAERWVINQYNT